MSHPLDPLISAWLVDELDAEGVQVLENALRTDPSARARFAAFCQSEVVLPQALGFAPRRPATTGIRRAVRGNSRMRLRRPDGRLNWLWPITAAALVAVIVVFGVTRPASAPPVLGPTITQTGPLELITVGNGQGDAVLCDGRPLRVGMQAPRGARVEIVAPGVEFRWRDGTRLLATPGTILRVIDGETAIELLQGRGLEVHVTQRMTAPFRIDAPHASATVMGTHFAIGGDTDATVLVVKEGRVRFSSKDMVQEVIAGESAAADRTGLTLAKDVRVLGFVLTARDVTRVLGSRMVGRGTVRLADLPKDGINLRIDCLPEAKSVRTGMRGVGNPRLEQVRDYFVFGDSQNRATTSWKPHLGTFIIDAQAFADVDGREPLGPPVVFELTIVP